MDALNRIPLSPYPSVAASSLFPTADLVVKDDDESKVDNEVFISLGKCFEKWSEMPDSAENFWNIINAWHTRRLRNRIWECNLNRQFFQSVCEISRWETLMPQCVF